MRLTTLGYQAACDALRDDRDMLVAFTAHVEHDYQHSRHEIDAPYACWVFLQQRLIGHVFSARGGRRKVPSPPAVTLRRVTTALNFMDRHPALKGVGMVEWQALRIPAWEIDGRLSLYPQRGHRFVILTPEWLTARNGTKVTTWIQSDGDPVEERAHLLLWRHPGRL